MTSLPLNTWPLYRSLTHERLPLNTWPLYRSLTHERLLYHLSQCESSIAKSQLGCQMNETELKNYETLYKQIDTGTEAVKAEIVKAKEELNAAKQVRLGLGEWSAGMKINCCGSEQLFFHVFFRIANHAIAKRVRPALFHIAAGRRQGVSR